MDEVRQTIGQILDGFCDNHTDLFPTIELLKTYYEQLPSGSQTDFFKVLAERLQSEPISFPTSGNVRRSSHTLIIRAWAAFGPADALPNLIFSLLRPDTHEAMELWAVMIGTELHISLGSYADRFSQAALATIKGQCAVVTCDQSIGLTNSRFPSALVKISQGLENLVKKVEFDRNVVQKLRPQVNATRPAAPQRDATTREIAMDTVSSELWKRFDQSLFELKLREPSHKMQEETESRWRKVRFDRQKIGQGEGIGLFLALADSDFAALRDFLEKDIDRICREVWRAQGNSVSAEFVRVVLKGTVLNTIEVRVSAIKWGIEEVAQRQRSSEDLFPVRTHLAQATEQLKSILANRYEIEARELEWKNTEGPREDKKPNKAQTARRITRAPSPPAAVGGPGLSRTGSKPTQIPSDFPVYFPSELKAKTTVILAESVRKFQHQTQTLELCKHVISKMTPLFSEAVETGTIKAGAVLEEGLGGMGDLLRFLLIHNDDGPLSGFGLSDKAYRLGQEARKSEEWLQLARAIVDAEGKQKALIEALGDVAATVAPSEPTSGLNLERSLFAPAPQTWISRATPKRNNQGRPRADKPSEELSHSPDYRSVTIRGKVHTLTARQAQMIEILHKAHVNGNPDVSTAHILEMLETRGSRWQDTFRTNPKAKNALIKSGARRGTLRLNL